MVLRNQLTELRYELLKGAHPSACIPGMDASKIQSAKRKRKICKSAKRRRRIHKMLQHSRGQASCAAGEGCSGLWVEICESAGSTPPTPYALPLIPPSFQSLLNPALPRTFWIFIAPTQTFFYCLLTSSLPSTLFPHVLQAVLIKPRLSPKKIPVPGLLKIL